MSIPQKPTNSETDKRAYYEVWGDSLSTLQNLWKICAVQCCIILILLILLNRSMHKPPVVIRVDSIGKAEAITDYALNNRVSQAEAVEFVRLFLRDLLDRNFLTWQDNLEEADKLTTPRLRSELNGSINWKDETSAIVHGRLTCKLVLSDVTVTQETKNSFLVTVKGFRKITSPDDSTYSKETVFESALGINKVRRTATTPYGLLVDSYHQEDFKHE